jgi:hypothetical protein
MLAEYSGDGGALAQIGGHALISPRPGSKKQDSKPQMPGTGSGDAVAARMLGKADFHRRNPGEGSGH